MLEPIPGYKGRYSATRCGKVYSHVSKKYLSLAKSRKGYLTVILSKAGKVKGFLVHRLVAIVYIKNPNNKPQINHKDCCKTNNHIDNLEWVTDSENVRHSIDSGIYNSSLFKKDYDSRRLKWGRLTIDNVIEIRILYSLGMSQAELGRQYGISQRHAGAVAKRELFKHVM